MVTEVKIGPHMCVRGTSIPSLEESKQHTQM